MSLSTDFASYGTPPPDGQEHTDASGVVWVYDLATNVWSIKTGAELDAITNAQADSWSDVRPTTPRVGQKWTDSATGKMYQWTGDVWFQVNYMGVAPSFPDGTVLPSYYEQGEILTSVSGVLTIPIDGKNYGVNVTEAITSIVTTEPTAPNCGNTTVMFLQDATGYAVSIPVAWEWPDSTVTDIDITPAAKTRLTLYTDVFGAIQADAEVRGVA